MTRNSCGIDSPPPSSAIATAPRRTMNSAFRMLLAAMMRERCDGVASAPGSARRAARCRSRRTGRSARGRRRRASAPGCARNASTPGEAGRVQVAAREPQVDREHGQADRAERHEADLDLAARQPLAQQRADADADREQREQQRDDVLVAAEDVAREVRRTARGTSRRRTRTTRCRASTATRRGCRARSARLLPGLGERVPVDRERRVDRRASAECARLDEPAGDRRSTIATAPASTRPAAPRSRRAGRRRSCRAGSRRTCPSRPGRCRRPARRACRCCGRIAYLTGPNSVECTPISASAVNSSDEVAQPEADGADHHDRDLEELDQADQARLLVLVGELARRSPTTARTAG